MKKNIDQKTVKLFEAARAAYIENYSTGVIKSPIAKNVTAAEIGRFLAWIIEDNRLVKTIENCYTSKKQECQRRRRAIANNIKKCGYSVTLQDENKVINLIDGFQCGVMALPRIYSELCRLVGEKPIEMAAWPINEAAKAARAENADTMADNTATPAAGYMSGETTRGRVYYVNNHDNPVSRVVDLERINHKSQLPMWIMAENNCNFIVFQLSDNIFFRANGCYIPDNYMAALRGDYSIYDEKIIANDMANAAAIPAKQFTPEYWPNMAVVNAYQAAGMVEDAQKLLTVRNEIKKQREAKKKAEQQEQERKELERKQAEEKRLNEAAAQFMNSGSITAADVVALCDRENISINPRTRHNLLEIVNCFENNGNRINYRQFGKRKPILDGCFSVVSALRERLSKTATDAAEQTAEPVADVVEAPADDVTAEPVTDAAADEVEAPCDDVTAEPVTDATADAEAVEAWQNEQATADTYTAEEVAAMVAAAVAEERARHTRRRFAPRLWPVLRRLGRVAAAILPLLIVALIIGTSTASTPAADAAAVTTCQAAAETVAQVVELPAVTVTASRLTTPPAAPSPVKKLAAPSPVKKAAADVVTLSSQKTAADIATAAAPAADDTDSLTTAPAAAANGLTICAGTPWAYTMMIWA